ncbi:hypothetical protein BB347_16215 [Natronorubrum daqingense]|uniref:Uncharacterized protein n=1 Tax=Natronorubrum daqingense TaxID=588898 RepID=A0A1P8RI12_9EURY|nr:hypothetical protein BB347_16215 [Natronorubrum daqingense]
MADDDIDGELGTLDVTAMDAIRSAMVNLDGLIDAAGFENPANPKVVRVYISDGIGDADSCRFDIRWYRKGYYSFHHSDSVERHFRWDFHPKLGAPDAHFHPPPDAPSPNPEPSCLGAGEPPVIARAVHKLWRRAYDTGETAVLNTAEGKL